MYLESLFISLLLSLNGWANLDGKTNSKVRIKFRQPYSNKDYIYYLHREIKIYCEKEPYRFTSHQNFKKRCAVDEILITTRWLFCFVDIYNLLYKKKNEKKIPYNIYDLLTPLVLAHLVMGSSIKLRGRGLKLYIGFLNISDAVKLINVLIVKYGLQCNLLLEIDKRCIYIYRSSLNLLFVSIKPYMISPM